jgi:SAM-dependent methyltransferase
MPKTAVCAEIGVWKGEFSELIRSMTLPRKLHLIDPWKFQGEFPERMYGGSVAKEQSDMDRIYENVRNRFNNYQNIILHRGKSEKVLQDFENAYFDWVYIDGNHYYEYVLNDLQICLSKVKPGGIIAGDDYTWGEKDGFPVKRAVQDFIKRNNLKGNLELIGSQFIIKT